MRLQRQNSAPPSIPSVSSGTPDAAHASEPFVPEAQTPRSTLLEGLAGPSPRLRARAGKTTTLPSGEPSPAKTRQRRPEAGQSSRAASERAESQHRAGRHPGDQQVASSSATQGSYAARCVAARDRLKAQLRAGLQDRPFAEPSKEQLALEAQYLQWADARLQERIEAFGPDAAYDVAGDMKAAGMKASLPIAYESLRSFFVGALRTPLGISAATAYQSSRPPLPSP
ncbi:conserved hypothetical protein [Xanthomonas citri pv. fuscans]